MAEQGEQKKRTSVYVVRAVLALLGVGIVLVACTYDQWLSSAPIGRVERTSTPRTAPTSVAVAPTVAANSPTAGVAVSGGTAFGLAWFHKPPEDGTSVKDLAAQVSYIHLTSFSDVAYMKRLRDAGYKGPIYTYLTGNGVEGPGPYMSAAAKCDASFVPHDNNLAWTKGDFCKYIHPNESWFLHNNKGERLVLDYFGANIWTYLMNPADPGWRKFAYDRLKIARDTMGYSGVWLDNFDIDLSRARSDMKNSTGSVAEYSSDAAFRTAMQGWLAGARQALGDWPIWANLVAGSYATDAFDAYAPYLNGGMDESFAVKWIDGWLSAANWDAQLRRAEQWMAAGKGLVMVGQGPQEDAQRMRFTLASYMLVTQPDLGFFRYTRYDTYYNSLWLYPDYDDARKLGAPTGPRQQIKPGIWQRPFEHGTVEVDINEYTGQIILR